MYISVLVFSLLAAGCGTDEGYDEDQAALRVRQERAPEPVATTPPPAELEEPVVEAAEPPREVTYEEAEAAFNERRYKEAVELFALYTERKSENPWGFYMLGLSAWKTGENITAEEAFRRALELDPKHVKSYLNLGRVLIEMSRPAEALEKIAEALAIDPQSHVAYRLKGRAYRELAQAEEAIGAYRKAVGIDDRDAWSMNNMALIYIEQGRYEDALAPLARAVEITDDVAVFHNNLGMALECTGHYRAAEEAYKTALAIDESYEKAYANLERIESVDEDPGVEPVDLARLAQSFIDEIERWKVAATDVPADSLEATPDSIVVGDASIASSGPTADAAAGSADSTGGDQEQ
jgi:tetratricopeptide (TPR) repeat protein